MNYNEGERVKLYNSYFDEIKDLIEFSEGS